MAKRGRKPKESIIVVKCPKIRFAYSYGAVFSNDGQYRWWQEYGDSGYDWDGHFDIITMDQLKERIHMCGVLGIPVYEKIEPVDNEAGFEYEHRLESDL